MCYSYRDRRIEDVARRKQWEKEERKHREQPNKDHKQRTGDKDRQLVRA